MDSNQTNVRLTQEHIDRDYHSLTTIRTDMTNKKFSSEDRLRAEANFKKSLGEVNESTLTDQLTQRLLKLESGEKVIQGLAKKQIAECYENRKVEKELNCEFNHYYFDKEIRSAIQNSFRDKLPE